MRDPPLPTDPCIRSLFCDAGTGTKPVLPISKGNEVFTLRWALVVELLRVAEMIGPVVRADDFQSNIHDEEVPDDGEYEI